MDLLPEELLHFIVKSLAYRPSPPEFEFPEFQLKYPSLELKSLSLVNKKLRRICIPLLFAYLYINDSEEKLRVLADSSGPHLEFLRMLELGAAVYEAQDISALNDLLPQTKRLSVVKFGSWTALAECLSTIHKSNPSITILVGRANDLIDGVASLDLSRVKMPYANYPTDLAKRELLTSCLTQGMQVTHLTVLYAQELDEKCWRQDYKDLRMITIDIRSKLLHDSPFTISWFSEISSYYPNLHKIQFVVYSDGDLNLRCLPFLTSFIERSRHQQLEDITLKELAISRASRPSSCQDFYVSKVTVVAQPSLIEHLSVLSASFQDTEKLTIQSTQNNRFEYDIDDLINALARFKSLQLLRSWDLFRLLVRNKPEVLPFTPFPPLESTLSPKRVGVEAEYWVYWFVNQIALSVPSLQVLRVDENGYGQLQSRGRTRWYLDGWLEIQAESRAIINALELFDDEML